MILYQCNITDRGLAIDVYARSPLKFQCSYDLKKRKEGAELL